MKAFLVASASRSLWFWFWTRSDIFWNANAVMARLSSLPGQRGRGAVRRIGDGHDHSRAARSVLDHMLELIHFRLHRVALIFVERIGELGHLPSDESFLASPLALARAAEAVEGDQVRAEYVHGARDSTDLVLAAARALDPCLEITAGQCVQDGDAIGQRRKRTGHVVAEAEEDENQEGDHRSDGDLADPFLSAGELRHILDADQTGHQTAEVGPIREHHGGVDTLVRLDRLQRVDLAEVDELPDAVPQVPLRACEEPSPAIDNQHRRLRRLLHLLDRLVDAGRVHRHAGNADRTGGSTQRDPQDDGDVPLLVVADAANAGTLQNGVSRHRGGDDRSLKHSGPRGVGERSVGADHVEPIGEALIAKSLGDDGADSLDRFLLAGVDGMAESLVLCRDPGLVFHALDQAVVGLAPQGGPIRDSGAGVLLPDQLLTLQRGERETNADDGEGQDDEQTDSST